MEITIITHGLPTFAAANNGLPNMTNFFATLTTWLLGIITAGGGFFLLIDMAKHLFATPRDLRAAGIDLAIFAILLAVASQATAIANGVRTLITLS